MRWQRCASQLGPLGSLRRVSQSPFVMAALEIFTMTDFDNTNRGAIYRNDQKKKETERDYAGTLNVNGAEY
jgi:hypothetical protein